MKQAGAAVGTSSRGTFELSQHQLLVYWHLKPVDRMDSDERGRFLKKLKTSVAVVTVTVLLILLLINAARVFLLIFAGVMVAVFFRGIAEWLSRVTKIPMKASLPTAVILVLAIWAGLIFLLQPKVSEQVAMLQKEVPKAAQKVQDKLQQSDAGRFVLRQLPFGSASEQSKATSSRMQQNGSGQSTPQSSSNSSSGSKNLQKKVRSFFSSTLGVLGDFYVILLLGAFFTAAPLPYKRGIVALVPKDKRDRAGEVVEATGINLRMWLFGKMLSMLVVAVLTFIGLWILGVPLFITLALLAGLLSFIPNFGPLLAIVPAFLVGYVQEPSLGYWVIGLYVMVQTVESNLITPIIMREQINVPLAMTLASQLLLGTLVGGLGLIFATPIMAMFMIVIQMLYIEDTLGDRRVNVKAERVAKKGE